MPASITNSSAGSPMPPSRRHGRNPGRQSPMTRCSAMRQDACPWQLASHRVLGEVLTPQSHSDAGEPPPLLTSTQLYDMSSSAGSHSSASSHGNYRAQTPCNATPQLITAAPQRVHLVPSTIASVSGSSTMVSPTRHVIIAPSTVMATSMMAAGAMQTSPTSWYPTATVLAAPGNQATPMQMIPQPYAMTSSVLGPAMMQPSPALTNSIRPAAHYATAAAGSAPSGMPYSTQTVILQTVPPVTTGHPYIQLAQLPLPTNSMQHANTGVPVNSVPSDSAATVMACATQDGVENDVAKARENRLYSDPSSDPAAVRLPTGRIAFSCGSCKLTFLRRRHLEIHFTSHRSRNKPTLCHICGKCFPRPDHVNRHASSRHTTVVYPCQLCGKEFERISNLHKHWKEQHGSRMEASDETDANTPSDSNSASDDYSEDLLTAQQRLEGAELVSVSNSASPRSPVSREQLNAAFATSLASRGSRHSSSVGNSGLHPGASPTLPGSMSLASTKRGVRGAPNLPRRFQCQICRRMFARSAHLNRHLRIHTGDKPFRCFRCGRCYARGDYLRTHLTSQHNQTPLPCEICGEDFQTITELNLHQKSRHGRMKAWFLQSHDQQSAAGYAVGDGLPNAEMEDEAGGQDSEDAWSIRGQGCEQDEEDEEGYEDDAFEPEDEQEAAVKQE